MTKAICILGMHRSGTSVITRAINLLGAYIGNESDLIPPEDYNPVGFWERGDVVDFHERLMRKLGIAWDVIVPLPQRWHLSEDIKPFKAELKELLHRNFSGHNLWAWKDPRTSVLLDIWKDVLVELDVELRCLYVIRNPIDVVRSFERRKCLTTDRIVGVWFNYNLAALNSSSDLSRTFISYDKFMHNWEEELRRCAYGLGVAWPQDGSGIAKKMKEFIRPDLRHSVSSLELLKAFGIPQPVTELYALLEGVAVGAATPGRSLEITVKRLTEEFLMYARFFRHDYERVIFLSERLEKLGT